MLLKRLLVRYGWLLVFAAAARAGVITDPTMGVEAGDLSYPIATGVNLIPNNGGGVFGFYTPTESIITGLVFQTTIQRGLLPGDIAAAFICSDASTPDTPKNPFFLHCSFGYDQPTGLLTISFYGVNPPDGDELPTDQYQEDEAGPYEHEGIPPLKKGCELTPEAVGCTDIGHFLVTLNDNFATTGDNSGGWSNPIGVAEIDTSAPEPSPAIPLAAALLCLAAIARKARRA